MKPKISMSENRVKLYPNPISVQRHDKILIKGYKDIKENQGQMSRILLKISRKIREFSWNT